MKEVIETYVQNALDQAAEDYFAIDGGLVASIRLFTFFPKNKKEKSLMLSQNEVK